MHWLFVLVSQTGEIQKHKFDLWWRPTTEKPAVNGYHIMPRGVWSDCWSCDVGQGGSCEDRSLCFTQCYVARKRIHHFCSPLVTWGLLPFILGARWQSIGTQSVKDAGFLYFRLCLFHLWLLPVLSRGVSFYNSHLKVAQALFLFPWNLLTSKLNWETDSSAACHGLFSISVYLVRICSAVT